jgi:hypothetical protein
MMMIQSRCKFKLKRIRSALARIIYSCLTYSTLIVGLFLISNTNGEYFSSIIYELEVSGNLEFDWEGITREFRDELSI